MSDEKIIVAGAAGYLGRHLVADLLKKGYTNIVAVSRKELIIPGVKCVRADLREYSEVSRICEGASLIYNCAAVVGGIGFIVANLSDCLASSIININFLRAAPKDLLGYLFCSSSCVYPSMLRPVSEDDVSPGVLNGYPLEKYFSEKTCLAFAKEKGVPVRLPRLHTIYGPGDFRGGIKNHFPSALTEKVVEAKLSGVHEIRIWGGGDQTRSLIYIDDCVEGLQKIMNGGVVGPVNLASSEKVSVNGIVDVLEEIAAIKLQRFYNLSSVVGAEHKTSDNTKLRAELGWEPMTPTRTGMERLYRSCWENQAFLK